MNRHAVCATFVATVGATLALVNTAAVAAKPAPPPPPPPPTPTSCTGMTGLGVFPAMVYSKTKYKTVKRGGGTTVYDGSDIYLADGNGKCSILILGSTYQVAFSYRQIGTEARVAFLEANSIRLLKFTVANGSVGSLPLSPSIVYTPSWTPGGVNDVELSADGQTIFFTEEIKTTDGRWIDTLYSISLASCSSSCPRQFLYEFKEDSGVSGLSVNSAGDRLYMSIHDRVPDIRTISFLQKQGGVWSSLRHVVSDQDGGYQSVSGFAATAFGRWDYNGSSVLKDVLAYVVESTAGATTDIIDVTNCAAATIFAQASCLSSGESQVVNRALQATAQVSHRHLQHRPLVRPACWLRREAIGFSTSVCKLLRRCHCCKAHGRIPPTKLVGLAIDIGAGPQRPASFFRALPVNPGPCSACSSVPARSRCAQLVDPHGPRAGVRSAGPRGVRHGLGRRGGSVGPGKTRRASSAYSHRTGLSVVLKIRVSMVRFRPWPPLPSI